uniref:Bifunctional inhibitor/plant lipid transfer protein/seed storage helical domain-containing protein n=1 Tax=Triticum urartu TaxID=4572 RepID=A0A8R7VDA5_TRIUA
MTNRKVARVLCLLVFLAIYSCSRNAQPIHEVDHCTIDKNNVIEYCTGIIEKNLGNQVPQPWTLCCGTIRGVTDIHCICDRFTAHDLTRISLPKFACMAYICGKGLHPHTHCAGYLVPVMKVRPPPPGKHLGLQCKNTHNGNN